MSLSSLLTWIVWLIHVRTQRKQAAVLPGYRLPIEAGTRGTVHLGVRGHERFAGKIANHQIHAVDAKRPRALVGRAVAGIGNIHTLVRAAFVSEIDLRV